MKESIAKGSSRGSISDILLKALASGDKYGYEINKEIETISGGQFFMKEASLYSGLKRLEANRYIKSYWKISDLGINRHYYSITKEGLDRLNRTNLKYDERKSFIDDLYKQENVDTSLQLKNVEENNKIESETLPQNSQNIGLNQIETQKNPFAIEVAPNQQDIFSILQETNEKDNNVTGVVAELKNVEEIEKSTNEIRDLEKVTNVTIDLEKTTTEINNEIIKDSETIKDDEYLNKISKIFEESSIKETKNEEVNSQTPSSFDLEQQKNIEKNYNEQLFEKLSLNAKNAKQSYFAHSNKDYNYSPDLIIEEEKPITNKFNELSLNNTVEIEPTVEIKDVIQPTVDDNLSEKVIENIKNDTDTKIKSIFGNLIADDSLENVDEQKIEETVKQEEIIIKELPRIKLENDFNDILTKEQPNKEKIENEIENANRTFVQQSFISNSFNTLPTGNFNELNNISETYKKNNYIPTEYDLQDLKLREFK